MYDIITNNSLCRLILSWRPPRPSASAATIPISATIPTKRKFRYQQGLQLRECITAAERHQCPMETSCVHCCVMSALLRGLACLECSDPTLNIRVTDRPLGLVCLHVLYYVWQSYIRCCHLTCSTKRKPAMRHLLSRARLWL